MATIPMFQTPKTPDAWHRVTAPGGYEVWRLEAEDAKSDLRMVARLWNGSPTDWEYRRAYERYLRHPTRRRPPVPGDCIGAELTVWRGGRVWGDIVTRASALAASAERVEVRIGATELLAVEGGLKLVAAEGGVEGEWTFHTLGSATGWEGSFPSRAIARAEHRWLVPAASYNVEGVIRVGNDQQTMSGRGFHDHMYGTGPMGDGMRRWLRGRAVLGGRVLMFQVADARRGGAAEGILLEMEGDGVREVGRMFEQKGAGDWPMEMEFGGRLRLSDPREVGRGWVEYTAAAGGDVGRGLCEIVRL